MHEWVVEGWGDRVLKNASPASKSRSAVLCLRIQRLRDTLQKPKRNTWDMFFSPEARGLEVGPKGLENIRGDDFRSRDDPLATPDAPRW